ncbi:unnamed protein product [Ixodes persulcatus]
MVDVWDVRTQLLNYFHSHPGENVRTVDLCRVIKQPKKTINSVLYRLQRDGVLQKVVESPPTWREAGSGSRIEQQYSIGYPNDGAAVSSFKLVVSSKIHKRDSCPKAISGFEHLDAVLWKLQARAHSVSKCSDCSRSTGLDKPSIKASLLVQPLVPSSANAVAPAASTPPASTNNILQTDLTALVISHLRTVGTPVYTKDMVKALGLKHKREVNPILYRLQDRGVLTKVWDTPPAWTLVPGSYGDLERNNLFAAAAAAAAAGKQQAGGQAPQREIQAPPDFGTAGDEEFAGGARPNGVGPRGGLKGPPKPRQQPLPPHELLRLSNTFAQMVMQQQGATANGGVAPAAPSAAPNLKITHYASLTKNPVSAFHEFGQMQHVEAKIDIVATDGPPHNPRFKAVAFLDKKPVAEAWDKTKKEAKHQAAELAFRKLVASGALASDVPSPETDILSSQDESIPMFDIIAALSHREFSQKVLEVPEYVGGRKVLAALVMKNGATDRGTVVCFGTGGRCITGEQLSQDGTVVNDSHAEVITRRSFLRLVTSMQ